MQNGFRRFQCHGKKLNLWMVNSKIISISQNFFQEVQRLEVLCKQLYESQDASARSEAEKGLVTFQNSGDR